MAGYQPGARWRAGPFDDVNDGDINDWMAQRKAAMAINRQADAVGRQAWVDGIRSGQNVQAPNPSDVTAIGMQSLQAPPLSNHPVGSIDPTTSIGPEASASEDQPDLVNGGSQPPPQTPFPRPSFGPTGYVPGLLGDLSWLKTQEPNPIFDTGLASDGDADWIPAGGKTPRQRRQWSEHYGQDWPTVPETGENYHLHHFTPKADGGGEGLDNYGPMEPSAHRQHHMDDGDFSRWAKRRWPVKPGLPEVNGLGILQLVPDITGIMSGRIRTDSMDNFFSDMLAIASQEDIRQYHERLRQKFAPNSPPGTWVGET